MATPKKAVAAKSAAKKGGAKKSQSAKAGLIFPVARVGRLLRKGHYAPRVSPAAAVYMAATLEYLTSELIELASKVAVESKSTGKKRITPRALTLAVRKDADLSVLFKQVTIAKGGVVATASKSLEKKKKAAKSAKKASATPRV
jgi:histone H2A